MSEIRYKIDGAAFVDGMPIHLISESFHNIQSLFDKSFCTLMNRKRISSNDRLMYALRTSSVDNKCLLSNIGVYLEYGQQALAIAQSVGANDLVSLTFSTFDFLKLVYSLNKSKEKYRVENNGDNCVVIVGDGNEFTFNGPVYLNAVKSADPWRAISNQVDGENIDSVIIDGFERGNAVIDRENNDMFDIQESPDNEDEVFNCDIIRFDKIKNTGLLDVYPDDKDKYKCAFDVIGGYETEIIIRSMLRKVVKLRCKKTVCVDPVTREVEITKLHVVEVVDQGLGGQGLLV